MKGSVSILNFDDVYKNQKFFKKINYEWIELSDIKSTNRYCGPESLEILNKRLAKRKNQGISFIGSGNYHYISYLFISEFQMPFTLILFDHHTDMIKPIFDSLISCGSWVLEALEELPMLERVIMIGVNQDLIETIPSNLNERVCFYGEDYALEEEDIVSKIPTNNVYISIDKDVLAKSETLVNWDQGSMELKQLIKLVKYIDIHKNVCGADICGEYSIAPPESFLHKSQKAVLMNDRANRIILKALMN